MREVIRNSRGDWCVATPVEKYTYGTAYNMRELRRIPIEKTASRDRAAFVAKSMGLL